MSLLTGAVTKKQQKNRKTTDVKVFGSRTIASRAFTNLKHGPVNVACRQTTLHVHENSCTVLIEYAIENYFLSAHTDHYAFRK